MSLHEEPHDPGSGSITVDEAPSIALLPAAVPPLLIATREGPDLEQVVAECLRLGLRPVHLPDLDRAPQVPEAPEICVVESSLPGAKDYLQALFKSPRTHFVVAVANDPATEAELYQQGANVVLRRPLDAKVMVAVLSANRRRALKAQQSEVVVEHDRRVSAADAFEGLLRALGQEVRNPLATALANMEYLSEETAKGARLTLEDQASVVDDSLASLRQIRLVLENISALIPREPPLLSQLRLWSVAQRVIDELPASNTQVSLIGDSEVRGWGDETTLVEVATSLVRRAIADKETQRGSSHVSIHVYAHDDEARMTVHEHRPSNTSQLTSDPFNPSLTLGEPGQSGLLLTAARHAMVRMGGSLAFVPKMKSGCAFRMRLRIAQPNLL